MLPPLGYTWCASLVPAITANHTPSRMQSIAAAVACWAARILVAG